MEILRCRNLFLLYAQNLPTVALFLPRAGLNMALLFTNHLLLQIPSFSRRDQNFFQARRKSNGSHMFGSMDGVEVIASWLVVFLYKYCFLVPRNWTHLYNRVDHV